METAGVGVLVLLGLAVFGGMLGAWLFQRMHIPQVVGYICIGILIGESGLRWIQPADIAAMQPLNLFALGVIGFLVGGEIQLATLRKYARQFTAILLGEGLLSFLLVGGSTFAILWLVTRQMQASLAAGLVLGAIASATDPASTIDVLWENRARGVLTTAVIAIVALDDALAMTLYGLGTSLAELISGGEASVLHELGGVMFELFGAVALGALAAVIMNVFLRWSHKPERSLSLVLGLLLLTIGAAAVLGMDVILAAMTMGVVLTNLAPRRSRDLFETARSFSVPIYVMFFVLVGARLGVRDMPGWLWWVVGAYVLFRSTGKILGAHLGARLTRSEPVVQRYLGTALFAQGGVAVGLSIMASHHLDGVLIGDDMVLGDLVVFTVTATTLVVQLTGPPLVKWVVKRSGEGGRNVTEEDLLRDLAVGDVMIHPIQTLQESDSVRRIVDTFAERDQLVYPVVSPAQQVVGTLSTEELKEVLADRDAWDWLVAADLMVEARDLAAEADPLAEVLHRMRDTHLDVLPVVASREDPRAVGMVTSLNVRKQLADELLARRDPSVLP